MRKNTVLVNSAEYLAKHPEIDVLPESLKAGDRVTLREIVMYRILGTMRYNAAGTRDYEVEITGSAPTSKTFGYIKFIRDGRECAKEVNAYSKCVRIVRK